MKSFLLYTEVLAFILNEIAGSANYLLRETAFYI